ncbi:class I SAM-dependent methyltransferase [Mesoterricola silvestris]|uniref:Methyltransferase n=1 Tax=Mesoterricola silvestris TaxID=2927979 RepID=A0AA48K9R1_9BACT|nr:class I SAM-dependent methyltransferase [Mesoterricola silvestris]BDU73340.1 methyltransferase [Mesoterricola silvestris]
MHWFERDFDHPHYFEIYEDKAREAAQEGPGLARLLGLAPGSLVLDLPCGWGRLRPALEELGYRVAGGDLSPMNLRRHAREFPGDLVRLDFRALPFRDGCADGVFCAYTSWGYFGSDEENQRQLDEFARVLRPGGTLLLDLAGRDFFLRALAVVNQEWYEVEGLYLERVRLSSDGRRFLTDRILRGTRFQHDIWIPTDAEARAGLEAAGLEVDQVFGSVQGAPWHPYAERWIYRATKR